MSNKSVLKLTGRLLLPGKTMITRFDESDNGHEAENINVTAMSNETRNTEA